MSHIVTILTEVQDPAAIIAACHRLELPTPVQGTATLFSGEATGLIVKLPDWLYPVVVDTATGEVKFDVSDRILRLSSLEFFSSGA